MLSSRLYKVLKFLEKQPEKIIREQIPFSNEDLKDLKKSDLVKSEDYTIPATETSFPKPTATYQITASGKDALELHRKERFHRIVGYVVTGSTLVLSVLSLLVMLI